jgi:hypothetical protein
MGKKASGTGPPSVFDGVNSGMGRNLARGGSRQERARPKVAVVLIDSLNGCGVGDGVGDGVQPVG